jgi:signal transduction histidine kinase
MSYRAFKRLFGETSLERKCRIWLGIGILSMMTLSFIVFARRTENLAYEQTVNTGRLLVNSALSNLHLQGDPLKRSLAEGEQKFEANTWPAALQEYKQAMIVPGSDLPKYRVEDTDDLAILNSFLTNPDKNEESRTARAKGAFLYYGAVRASQSCLGCHHPGGSARQSAGPYAEGQLMAAVRISVPMRPLEEGFHVNRAWLLTLALVTALFAIGFSYLIIRYVIVKPVKHLKEVADTIAAGELNVRSEIQTNDEFEDLSHAFNRMLRSLLSMQDKLKQVNDDLDRKVDQLAKANMSLYESNRLKSDFLATMSHELRTPLNSILGFSDVLLSGPHLTEKQGRWVGNIQSSGQQLLALINDLLDLAKIEAGKMQLHLEEFDLAGVVDQQVAMSRPLAEKKNIDLRGSVAAGLPPLRQDRGKLRQILSNLLSNAVKFTPEGGRVSVRAEAAGPDVVLTVADTGVGIAPEDQDLVFEKFRQAANPMTREQGGTGLGLSIVRELSQLLGGSVSLQSELGRGSTFTVRLPLRLPDRLPVEFEPAGPLGAAGDGYPDPSPLPPHPLLPEGPGHTNGEGDGRGEDQQPLGPVQQQPGRAAGPAN